MKDRNSPNAVLRIRMLGMFQAWRQDELLRWPTHKCKALLQILLAEPGRLVPSDQLLDWLWPDLPPGKARNNLWVTISQLRHALEPDLPPRGRSAYVIRRAEGYLFNEESDHWLDGSELATHLAVAQSSTDLNERVRAWDAARLLYHGEYLEDEPYAEWAQLPRGRWRRRYERLLVNLAEAHGQMGRFQQAISLGRAALAVDNVNESAYRLLMRCYAAQGERATALRLFDQAVRNLQDEVGVAPMPETAELARQILHLEGDWKLETVRLALPSLELPAAPAFVGRRMEISTLSQLLAKSMAGQGQVALIAGETGIGKSRLVQEAAIAARQQGHHVLIANCSQPEKAIPFQPLIDLARQLMSIDDAWQHLAPVWLRELAVLLPETGQVAAAATGLVAPSEEPDANRQGRLFQAIFHLFVDLAERNGSLLVVEDLHWADPTTLQCLNYLARRIGQAPMALILTTRQEPLYGDTELAAALDSLRRADHVTSLLLERLSSEDTTALLQASADTAPHGEQLSRWLQQETDGNPFFIVSLLQSLREKGLLDDTGDTDWRALAGADPLLTLPDAIRDNIRDRLKRLTHTEREALDWLAVHGSQLDFATLQAVSSQPQLTLLNALEQLTARQLLMETAGQHAFAHDKIREVVYYDLSYARRTLYHRQIALALEGASDSAEAAAQLAHHFERGGEGEKASRYWLQSGKQALAAYAYQQATRHFERVLALTGQPDAQMEASIGMGQAFMWLDQHELAESAIQQGLQLARQYDDTVLHARLLLALAHNASRQHRTDGGMAEAETVVSVAEKTGDDYHLAQGLLLLTEAHEGKGDLGSALKTAARAQAISARLNDIGLRARILVEMGFLRSQRAEFDEAADAARQALLLLAETDDRGAIAYARSILGRALGGRGDYGQALEAFRRSQEDSRVVGDRYLMAQARNMRGWLHRELGDFEGALRLDQEGVELALRWGKTSPEISARLNVALDILLLGDPQRALLLLDEVEQQINAGSFGFHAWRWQLRLSHARGSCFLAIGETSKALALAEEGIRLAEKSVTRKYIALNRELKGAALRMSGRPSEATVELEAAVALADAIRYQPTRWAGRQMLAELYQREGREKESHRAASEAALIIETVASRLKDEALKDRFLQWLEPH